MELGFSEYDLESLQRKGKEMKKNPMVTISLPCYNHEKYIRESIESVLAQTYQDFELVIIENGSTDHCRDIIREYEDRATVIYFDVNDQDKSSRVFQQETRGKYHAIMTSDDIWMPDKLEKQVGFLEKHPEYQACFTWAEYGDENMNTLYDNTFTLYKEGNRTPSEWLSLFWKRGNCLCAPSMVMKTQNYLEIFGQNIPYYQLFDLDAWVRFLLGGNQLYLYPEVLVKMRSHATAISYSGNEMAVVRGQEEMSNIRIEIMEQISDALFLETFGDELVRPGCTSHAELTCEKILFLFRYAQNLEALKVRALDFYYRHFPEDNVAETFSEKYFMTKNFFLELSKDIGTIHTAKKYFLMGRESAQDDNP